MLTTSISSATAAAALSLAGLGIALILAAWIGWNTLTRR